jgi:hypothetical protein
LNKLSSKLNQLPGDRGANGPNGNPGLNGVDGEPGRIGNQSQIFFQS